MCDKKKRGEKMARPTDDPKYYRIDLRINEEMHSKLIKISQQTGQTIAEYVRGLINNNDFQLSAEETRLLKDIFNMAKLNGVSKKEFLRILDNELTQGTLVIENGRLYNQ